MILDLPPPLWLPPKPAIIRPAEPIKPLLTVPLLAMPLTMGMLRPSASNPVGINSNNGGKSTTGSASWSHTTTADTNCLVVVGGLINNSQNNEITGVTFNSVALANAVSRNQTALTPHISIWYMLNPPIGAYTITCSGSTDRYLGGVSFNLGGIIAFDVANSTSSTSTSAITATATSTAKGVVVGGSMVNSASTDTLSGDITKSAANSASANSITRVCSGGYSSTALAAGTRTVTSNASSTLHAVAIAVFT